jgi:peptidoglycan/LPS O-acetylase OafA/YrhL
MEQPNEQYLPHIDAVRGAMAMWVFAFHASVLCGFNTPLIPSGVTAVDVFMFISGLLMTRNFLARQIKEPIESPKTICIFLVRRFFRLAPLYFPLLVIVLLFWSFYAGAFDEAMTAYPPAWAGLLSNDPSQRQPTFFNIVAHLSFFFGLFPKFASNNALPDWSLSLEMQFYLALPFVLIGCRRFGLTTVVLCLMIIQTLTNRYVGHNLIPARLGLWPQPSLLPLKINCFMTGVVMATYFYNREFKSLVLMFVLVFWDQNKIFSAIVLFCFLAMTDDTPLGGAIGFIKAKISGAIGRFFGDISYAVYLIHMPVLLMLSHFLLSIDDFRMMPGHWRFAALYGISAIVTVPAAFVAHIFIEKKGNNLGRSIARQLEKNLKAKSDTEPVFN